MRTAFRQNDLPLNERICKYGHIGFYFLNTRGHGQCRKCVNLGRRRASQKPADKARRAAYITEHKERILAVRRQRMATDENKQMNRAVRAVHTEIEAGRMTKLPCRMCGYQKVEFHHTRGYAEYNKLTGAWLCRKHHIEEHNRLKELEAWK